MTRRSQRRHHVVSSFSGAGTSSCPQILQSKRLGVWRASATVVGSLYICTTVLLGLFANSERHRVPKDLGFLPRVLRVFLHVLDDVDEDVEVDVVTLS